MSTGESPVECAIREAYEELGICLKDDDLNLFGYVSEKNYEGNGHWLMFLFDILPAINEIPKEINEGHFRFFNRSAIDKLEIPSTDFELVWPFYDKRKEGFWGVRANFGSKSTKIKVEARPV
jgi:8-oxo-dGTP diphosphatase